MKYKTYRVYRTKNIRVKILRVLIKNTYKYKCRIYVKRKSGIGLVKGTFGSYKSPHAAFKACKYHFHLELMLISVEDRFKSIDYTKIRN